MTDLLIRAFSRRPLRTLARPSAVLAFAVAVAYGVWLLAEPAAPRRGRHGAQRARDAAPLAARRDAVAAARLHGRVAGHPARPARHPPPRRGDVGRALRRRRGRLGRADHRLRARARAAPCTPACSAPPTAGPSCPTRCTWCATRCSRWPSRCRSCALVAAALLRREPWAEPQVAALALDWTRASATASRPPSRSSSSPPSFIFAQSARRGGHRRRRRRRAVPVVVAASSASTSPRSTSKIPLNRFGDNDPQGKMFVARRSRVDDVREQEASAEGVARPARRRRHPAAGHPRQPGRLRRDRVHQRRVGRRLRRPHRRPRLRHRVLGRRDRRQRAVGHEGSGETRTYRFYVPRRPGDRGRALHPPRPGLPPGRSRTACSARCPSSPRAPTYLAPDDAASRSSRAGRRSSSRRSRKAFREYALLHHEIGNEDEDVFDKRRRRAARCRTRSRRPTGRARGP